MAADFELEEAFTITGRGLVLAGRIREGVIRIGDLVRLPVGGSDRLERITGVEMGHGRTADGSVRGFVGLMVGELPPAEIPAVRRALSSGQRLEIETT